MAGYLGAGLLAITKGRSAHLRGRREAEQQASQQQKIEEAQKMRAIEMALEEAARRRQAEQQQATQERLQSNADRDYSLRAFESMNKPERAPARDPIADHLAKRKIDIANPLPSRARIGSRSSGSATEETTLPDGTLVQGKPPKTTEGEKKASALYGVALQDSKAIDAMESSLPGKMISKVPILGNIVTGQQLPEYQAQRAAANRFVDQWLRFTSGAQVTPSERENAIKTFIPEPGDTPATIAQKRAAREQVLEGLRRAAGNAAPQREAAPDVRDDAPRTPTSIARGDQYNDADYYEMLRGEGGTHEQAVAKVEARRKKRGKK